MLLHGYWRSTAAYRVRIALGLKGLPHDQACHDLRTGAHREEGYRALHPQGLVPALEAEGEALIQSAAIIEWLEDRYPVPPLLPHDPIGRARVRAMSAIVGSDIHPLNNLRVLNALRETFGADDSQLRTWIAHWIGEGFRALDTLIARHGGGFAYGDAPTLADCFLVPQVYAAERYGVDCAPYPSLLAAARAAGALPAVAAAHPDRQPDADPR